MSRVWSMKMKWWAELVELRQRWTQGYDFSLTISKVASFDEISMWTLTRVEEEKKHFKPIQIKRLWASGGELWRVSVGNNAANLRGVLMHWSHQNQLPWETRSAASPDLKWCITCLNRAKENVIHNACVERLAMDDTLTWNHQKGIIQLAVTTEKMEVPQTSVSHFAFLLPPMAVEIGSSDISMGWLLEM
jgi:hypothetical protein